MYALKAHTSARARVRVDDGGERCCRHPTHNTFLLILRPHIAVHLHRPGGLQQTSQLVDRWRARVYVEEVHWTGWCLQVFVWAFTRWEREIAKKTSNCKKKSFLSSPGIYLHSPYFSFLPHLLIPIVPNPSYLLFPNHYHIFFYPISSHLLIPTVSSHALFTAWLRYIR